MDFIRLFKVTGHLGEDLAVTDTHVHSEAQSIPDLVLDGMGNGNRIRIDFMGTGHIQEAFVDGVFLDNRCVFPADVHECPGGFFI